jgi:hypothetical protein
MDARTRVQMALDSVHGVDLNPFAVAIARFRLTVAALRAGGIFQLKDAPAFEYKLATGDSLLYGFASAGHLLQDGTGANSRISMRTLRNTSHLTGAAIALSLGIRQSQFDG